MVLDVAKVERAIERSIVAQRQLRSSVSCPAEVIEKAGLVFDCTATVKGRRFPFRVTEIDAEGHVRYVGEHARVASGAP